METYSKADITRADESGPEIMFDSKHSPDYWLVLMLAIASWVGSRWRITGKTPATINRISELSRPNRLNPATNGKGGPGMMMECDDCDCGPS